MGNKGQSFYQQVNDSVMKSLEGSNIPEGVAESIRLCDSLYGEHAVSAWEHGVYTDTAR